MKRLLVAAALALVAGGVLAAAVVARRYYALASDATPPEVLVALERDAGPSLADVRDPAERARAERGKYLVAITGCDGCHDTPGARPPVGGKYLAGGGEFRVRDGTTVVTRNLTPDAATGLGAVADEDVLRVLRSGVARDGRLMAYRAMPWAVYASWTEEDRRAVLTYLRHLAPVAHRIPDPLAAAEIADPLAIEETHFSTDHGAAPTAP